MGKYIGKEKQMSNKNKGRSIIQKAVAIALSAIMVIGTLPGAAFDAYADTSSNAVQKVPANAIELTKNVADQELDTGIYVLLNNLTVNHSLRIKSNATVTIYIKKDVTLSATGANGSGRTGGKAGVYVPSSSTLIVTGEGSLYARGGNAAGGASGTANGVGSRSNDAYGASSYSSGGDGGAGGDGGGGAGAGIGGDGGTGGAGASAKDAISHKGSNGESGDGTLKAAGLDGNRGGDGYSGSACGNVYALGAVKITAVGGSAGSNGTRGGSGGDKAQLKMKTGLKKARHYGSGGGGGGGAGGGGGYAVSIGSGGAGGGGGASGGTGGVYLRHGEGWTYPTGAGGSGGVGGNGWRAASGSDGKGSWISGYGGTGGSRGNVTSNKKVNISGDAYVANGYTGTYSESDTKTNPAKRALTYNYGASDKDTVGKLTGESSDFVLTFGHTKITSASKVTIPTRVGYTFNGYYSVPTAEDSVNQDYMVFTAQGNAVADKWKNESTEWLDADDRWYVNSPTTVYAGWSANDYDILLDANGGDGRKQIQWTYNHVPNTVDISGFQREGYTFKGFTTEKDNPDTLILSPTGTIEADVAGYTDSAGKWIRAEAVTLYALWEPIVYTVKFWSDGVYVGQSEWTYGSMDFPKEDNITRKLDSYDTDSEALREGILYKEHHNFLGWNIFPDQEWAAYTPGLAKGGLYGAKSHETVNLYAAWQPVGRVTVTYKANGGFNAPDEGTVWQGDSYVLDSGIPERKSYKFIGWNTQADGSGEWYKYKEGTELDSTTADASSEVIYKGETHTALSLMTNMQSSVTLYAVWQANPTLSFNANGGSYTSGTPLEALAPEAGSEVNLPMVTDESKGIYMPVKTGYKFAGWSVKDKEGNFTKVDSPYTMPEKNTVLFAQWEELDLSINYQYEQGQCMVKGTDGGEAPSSTKYLKDYSFEVWVPEYIDAASMKVYAGERSLFAKSSRSEKAEADGKQISYTVYTYTVSKPEGDQNVRIDGLKAYTYAVTLIPNGGVISEKLQRYTYSESAVTLPVPVKEGYEFAGWYTDKDCTKSYGSEIPAKSTGDLELYAKWTPYTYTISYNMNRGALGGAGDSPADQEMSYGIAEALTSVDAVNCYVTYGSDNRKARFLGWATSADAEVPEYHNGETVLNLSTEKNGAVTLYAVYDLPSFKVVYHSDDSNVELPETRFYKYGSTVNIDMTVSRTGYNLQKWNSISGEFTLANNTIAGIDHDYTLNAVWTPINYTVNFYNSFKDGSKSSEIMGTVIEDDGGESQAPVTQEFTYDVSQALTKKSDITTAPTDRDAGTTYYFYGWRTDRGESEAAGPYSVEYIDGQEVKNLTGTPGAVALVAVWGTEDRHYVAFDANGGSWENASGLAPAAADASGNVSLEGKAEPVREGYEFLGWADSANATEAAYNGEITGVTADKTVYAVWKKIISKYYVKYDFSGGTKDDNTSWEDPTEKATDEKFPILDGSGITKTGCTFMGWSSAKDSDIVDYAPGAEVANLSADEVKEGETSRNVATVYAVWKIDDPVYVTFNANGGRYSGSALKLPKGSLVTKDMLSAKGDPIREGYIFKGWSLDTPGTSQTVIGDTGFTVSEDTTVYAVWKEEAAYTITYRYEDADGSMKIWVQDTDTHKEGDKVALESVSVPAVSHKTFMGWKNGKTEYFLGDEVITITVSAEMADGNGVIYMDAIWEKDAYTIHYDANGGSTDLADVNVKYDEEITLPGSEEVTPPTGSEFTGWSFGKDGNVDFKPGAAVSGLTADNGATVTLYACYKHNQNKITFVFDDQREFNWVDAAGNAKSITLDVSNKDEAATEVTATYGEALPWAAAPERPGYEFKGYYTEKDGKGTQYYSADMNSRITAYDASCTELYAYWTPKTYVIHYVSADGKTEYGKETVSFNQRITIKDNQDLGFEIDPSQKLGWATKPNELTFEYRKGDALDYGFYYPNEASDVDDVVLYAVLRKNQNYEVKYDANGGIFPDMNVPPSALVLDGEKVSIQFETTVDATGKTTFQLPERDGYKFTGWSYNVQDGDTYQTMNVNLEDYYRYDEEGNLVPITDEATGRPKTVPSFVLSNATTIYAQWEADSYTITYDKNAEDAQETGQADVEQTIVRDGHKANFNKANTFERTGYTLIGWNKDDSVSVPTYSCGGKIQSDFLPATEKGVTLYAVWAADDMTVTLDYNGADTKGVSEFTASYGQSYGTYISINPSKTGYSFGGWFTDESFAAETQVGAIDKVKIAGNHTLYAKWIPNVYNITSKDNNCGEIRVWQTGDEAKKSVSSAEYGTNLTVQVIPDADKYTIKGVVLRLNGDTVTLNSQAEGNTETGIYEFRLEKDSTLSLAANSEQEGYKYYVTYDGNGAENQLNPDSRYTDFVIGDAQILWDGRVLKEDGITFETLTKPGYELVGWSKVQKASSPEYDLGQDLPVSLTTQPGGHVTLYAVWAASRADIDLVDYLGAGNTDRITVTSGQAYSYLPDLQKTGYKFEGWYTKDGRDNDDWGSRVDNSDIYDGSVQTLYAKWSEQKYTIVYNANGSGETAKHQTQSIANPKALEGEIFTREGWNLVGWSTSTNGNVSYGLDEVPSQPLTTVEDGTVNLYAVWEQGKVRVNLEDPQNSGGPSSIYLTVGGTYETLPTLDKTGYKFDGWYTKAEGGEKVDRLTEVENANNHTLYAHWTALTFSLNVRENAALGTIDVASAAEGETDANGRYYYGVTVKLHVAPKAGKTVAVLLNGKPLTAADEDYYEFEITEDSVVYLIAEEQLTGVYTVNYDANGGSGRVANETFMLDEVNALSYGRSISRSGYKLLGWSTDKDAQTAEFMPGESIKGAPQGVEAGGVLKLYAVWQNVTCRVEFDTDGGEFEDADFENPHSYIYGKAFENLPQLKERAGYRFQGWYKESGEKVYDTGIVPETENLKLKAQWQDTRKLLTVNDGGIGTFSEELAAGRYPQGTEFAFTVEPKDNKTIKVMAAGGTLTETEGVYKLTLSENTTVYLVEVEGEDNPDNPDAPKGDTYTVKYVTPEGVTGSISDQTLSFSGLGALSAGRELTMSGKTLIGWSRAENAAVAEFMLNEVLNGAPDGVEAGATLTLYPVWKNEASVDPQKDVTITLEGLGGAAGVAQTTFTRKAGGAYGTLPTPSKEHYRFTGWFWNNGAEDIQVDGNTALKSDEAHILTAKWEAVKWTVNVSTGELGTLNGITSDKYTDGDTVEFTVSAAAGTDINSIRVLKNGVTMKPEADGSYQFTITENTLLSLTSIPVTKPVWYISYDANGGTGGIETQSKYLEASVNLSWGNELKKNGYKLIGWATSADGGKVYDLGQTITAEAVGADENDVLTLYAVWASNTADITFNANGGAFSEDEADNSKTVSFEIGEKLGTLPEPARAGYRFIGWFTSEEDGSQIYGYTEAESNITYYAHWEDIRVLLTVNGNPNLAEIEGIQTGKVAAGTKVTFTVTPAADKKVKVLANGVELAAVNGQYSYIVNAETVISLIEVDSTDTPVGGTYTVHYELGDDVTGTIKDQKLPVTGMAALESGAGISRQYYTLTGWATTAGGEKVYNLSQLLNSAPEGIAADATLTLYPVWTANEDIPAAAKYKITLDANGGDLGGATSSFEREKDAIYGYLPVPSKEHYKFAGWYYGDKQVDANSRLAAEADHTLKAKWQPVMFTLTDRADSSIGSITVKTAAVSGRYQSGTEIEFTINAAEGQNLSLIRAQANGVWIPLDENGAGSFVITENTVLTLTSVPEGEKTWYVEYDANATDAKGSCGPYPMNSGGTNRLLNGSTFSYGVNTLVKWNTKPDGTGTDYELGMNINGMPEGIDVGETLKLYAVWKIEKPVKVTLDPQGGQLNEDPVRVYKEGDTYGAVGELPQLTRAGNVYFGGWFTDPDYAEGSRVYDNTRVKSGEYTLYAKWISPDEIIVTAHGYEGEYDGEDHALTISVNASSMTNMTYQWFHNGKAIANATGQSYYVKDVSESGGYYCIISGKIDGESYTGITSSTAKVHITPKEVTVKAADRTVLYGAEKPEYAMSYIGLAKTDSSSVISGKAAAACTYEKGNPVGAYDILADVTALKADNYTFAASAGKLTVKPRPVSLKWDADKLEHTGHPQSVTASVENRVGNDTFTLSYTGNTHTDVTADVNVPYTAEVTAIGNDNYTLAGATGIRHNWIIYEKGTTPPEEIVKPDQPEAAVTEVNFARRAVTITVDENLNLEWTTTPENAEVEFESSDSSIVSIDEHGRLTAVSSGIAVVTVTSKDGNASDSCIVTVNAKKQEDANHVTGVRINYAKYIFNNFGESINIIATVLPESLPESMKGVSYESTNPEVATVDEHGKVTANSSGKAEIIVRTEHGSYTAICEIEVNLKGGSQGGEVTPGGGESGGGSGGGGGGGTIIIIPPTPDKPDQPDEPDKPADVHEIAKKLKFRTLSEITEHNNVKVRIVATDENILLLDELRDSGYTVKFVFYRSTDKKKNFEKRIETENRRYLNNIGKKGTMYYYRATALIYDKSGKLVEKTKLSQCKYANRRWKK